MNDEQIKQLAVSCGFKLTNETGDDLKSYVYEFARELIALAQQVKPLEFKLLQNGCVHAETPFGDYDIDEDEYGFWFCMNGYYDDEDIYGSEDGAIAAANEDFQRRALSCLVHGGV